MTGETHKLSIAEESPIPTRGIRNLDGTLTLRKHEEVIKKSMSVESDLSDRSTSSQMEPRVVLFGQDLSHLEPNTQFFICTAGVFTFNVLYGYLQELLQVHIAGRKFALFLAVCQFTGYAFWAAVLARINRYSLGTTKGASKKVPTAKFVGLSLLRAFDLAVTNSAMQFLNYPAKTLIKSCRVVFTMIIGVLIRNKSYKPRDYIAVFTLVIGLAIFLHADSTSAAVFHPLGVLLLTVSLLCDGTLNNWSEQMMEEYNLSQDEFHARLYTVSLVATIAAASMRNEFFEGIDYFLLRDGTVPEIEGNHAGSTEWTANQKTIVLLLFGTTGILGASCLGAITKRFGALSMALTSTGRKATTLFLSFALFQNECSSEHVAGITLFMSGLLMKTFNKGRKQTAGQTPGASTKEVSSQGWWDARYRFLNNMLRRVGLRLLSSEAQAQKGILRKRSSIDMELGIQGD